MSTSSAILQRGEQHSVLNAFLAEVLVQLRLRFGNLSQNELLILMLISVHDGITINDLVQKSSISQPNVSRLLQALIFKEYVDRGYRRAGNREFSHVLHPYARKLLEHTLQKSAEAASLDSSLVALTT